MPATLREPGDGLVTLAHVIYALHALSIVAGISAAATLVSAFVFGWPSLVAVVLNYVKRSDAAGTFLESHFRWQIRTFWFGLLWCVVAALLFISIVGWLILWAVAGIAGLWVVYRIVRGWLALAGRRPLPT